MKTLANKGWKIGLRFDPVIPACNFAQIYSKLFKDIFSQIPRKAIHSASYGMMRFPKKMFKKIKKENLNKRVFSLPMENNKGIYSYPKDLENKLSKFMESSLRKYLEEKIIFNCKI